MRSQLATFAALTLLALGASTAQATTSISKAKSICKTEAQNLEPTPKSVRIRQREITSGEVTLSMPVVVTAEDGASKKLNCTVDRETQEATLTDAE